MKNLFFKHLFIFITASMALTIYSCYPENFSGEIIAKSNSSGQMPSDYSIEFDKSETDALLSQIPFEAISQNENTLVFSTKEELLTTVNLLREANSVWQTEIEKNVANLSEEIANAITIEDFYPYEYFEEQLNFSSLRSNTEAQIATWLATSDEELDFNLYPSHFIKDYAVRAVCNIYGEVVVGSTIHKEFEMGINLEIPELDFNLAKQFRKVSFDRAFDVAKANKLNFTGDWDDAIMRKNDEVCRTWDERNCRWSPPGESKRRLRGEVGVYNSDWWGVHKVWAENDTFKKSWGIWVRHRTSNEVILSGHYWMNTFDGEGNCNDARAVFLKKTCSNCSRLEAETHDPTDHDLDHHVSDKENKFLLGTHKAYSMTKANCVPEGSCFPHDCN